MKAPSLTFWGGLLAAILLLNGCAGQGVREGGTEVGQSPADLYVALAVEYYNRGDMETALRNAQKGLEEDSGNPRVHNVIATIYQQLGMDELAQKHFESALRIAPDDPYARTAWGNFLCEQKRYADAQAQFEQALGNALFNSPWIALTSAGTCSRSAGDTRKAEDYLRRALTANPRYFPALLEMAELDYDQGRYKSARNYLERYFKARGYTAKALVLAVRVERSLGSKKRARAYEQTLRKNFPDAPEVLLVSDS